MLSKERKNFYKKRASEIFRQFTDLHYQYMKEKQVSKKYKYSLIMRCFDDGIWKICIKKVRWYNEWLFYVDRFLHNLRFHRKNNLKN